MNDVVTNFRLFLNWVCNLYFPLSIVPRYKFFIFPRRSPLRLRENRRRTAAEADRYTAKGVPRIELMPSFLKITGDTRPWPILFVPRSKEAGKGNARFAVETTNSVDPDPAICPWSLKTIISSHFNKIGPICIAKTQTNNPTCHYFLTVPLFFGFRPSPWLFSGSWSLSKE